jgi:hypothetical protein
VTSRTGHLSFLSKYVSVCVILRDHILLYSLFSYSTKNQLGHYATSRKVARSSPDEVDFFQLT